MLTMRINEENLYNKLMKIKHTTKFYDFHYKDFFVILNVLSNGVILVSVKHDTFFENNFDTKYMYYTKNEVIKDIKTKIDNQKE
jgi:hypothetical protein